MKIILSLIIGGALAVSGFGQTRNVLVGTNNAVTQPTNFWSADAVNARAGLGLGSAATNPASAFQPSSLTLSNVSANNGGGLTNLNATNIVGILSVAQGGTGATNASDARIALGLGTAATNPATAFQSSSTALSNLATGNGGALSNLQATSIVGVIPASNIPSVTFTNLAGTLSIAQGGTGATNASDARANLGATTIGNTIFTATNAEDGRTALSLGSAATSAATAFQPANANLTNLSTNNGALLTNISIAGVVNLQSNLDTKLATNGNASGLSNITAANITGTVALASNITGTAPLATNVTGIVSLANGGTAATNAASARTSLGATTIGSGLFTLANPSAERFIRINADNTPSVLAASDFRTAIGLGTAATNPASAFQPSSSSLTNLSANNGSGLSNIAIAGVTGLQTALDGKLSATATAALATNVTGTVAIANGGTGATNVSGARTALGATTVGGNLFTLVNPSAIRFLRLNADNTATALAASDFRTAIGLGTAATNAETAFQPASTNLTLLAANNGSALTNLALSNVVGLQNALNTVAVASNVSGVVAITNGGSGATTAGGARTNFGLGATNAVQFGSLSIGGAGALLTEFSGAAGIGWQGTSNRITFSGSGVTLTTNNMALNFGAGNTNGASITRTNLGLGWSALTNTSSSGFQASLFGANTNPVLVNTNGEVVSPTNFWQVAPISTTVQYQTNVVATSTNNATNSRNLYLFSLTPSVSGVTNTVALPTNPATTFEGDKATITHLAQTTNSATAIRQLGASTNLITLNQLDETVALIYRGGQWRLAENISYIEPIYFSGTNAAANAAASRTNLGLGATNEVEFLSVQSSDAIISDLAVTSSAIFAAPIEFGGTNPVAYAATTRTNLGLRLPALTNTNNVNFRTAIGLGAANVVEFQQLNAQRIALSAGVNTIDFGPDFEITTEGDPFIDNSSGFVVHPPAIFNSNILVQGFLNFPTNRTNATPATNNQVQRWLQIRVGGSTNAFFIPLYQ